MLLGHVDCLDYFLPPSIFQVLDMAYVSQCLSQSNFTECTTSPLHLTQVRNHPMTSPGSKRLCGSVSFRGRAAVLVPQRDCHSD